MVFSKSNQASLNDQIDSIEVSEITGASALLFWEGDKLHFVMNFMVTDDHITTIHNMLNPDKHVGLHR